MATTALGLLILSACLLLYGSLVYPGLSTWLVYVHSRQRRATEDDAPSDDRTDGDWPSVSMLVPACNEAQVIEHKIQNFLALDYPATKLELLIGDDGSQDGTADCVLQLAHPRVRLLDSSARLGKPSTLNRLAQAAKFDYLLVTDANVILAPDAVARLTKRMEADQAAAVTGEVQLIGSTLDFSAGENFYYRIERGIQQAESIYGGLMGVDGGMYLIQKPSMPILPADVILDDLMISMTLLRAGKKVVYEPSAQARETGTPRLRDEFNRRARIAAGAVQLLRMGHVPDWGQWRLWYYFFSHKLIRWSSPMLLGAMALSIAYLAASANAWQLLLVTCVCAAALAGIVLVIRPLRRSPLGALVVYAMLGQAAILIGTLRGLSNRQSVRWPRPARQPVPASQTHGLPAVRR